MTAMAGYTCRQWRGWLLAAMVFAPQLALADCVILLHGLSRGDGSFWWMEKQLARAGYAVVNQQYPSTQKPIEALAPDTIDDALARCPEGDAVSFVTHSMGGILLRHYASQHTIEGFHAAVMLAPPNAGSEVVDEIGHWQLFDWTVGPAGKQLGTGEDSVPVSLGPVDFRLGVIAGDYSINPVFSHWIPGPDDGTVSVASTRIDGMSDHLVLPVSHAFLMNDKAVISQTIYFLQNGNFERPEAAGSTVEP